MSWEVINFKKKILMQYKLVLAALLLKTVFNRSQELLEKMKITWVMIEER